MHHVPPVCPVLWVSTEPVLVIAENNGFHATLELSRPSVTLSISPALFVAEFELCLPEDVRVRYSMRCENHAVIFSAVKTRTMRMKADVSASAARSIASAFFSLTHARPTLHFSSPYDSDKWEFSRDTLVLSMVGENGTAVFVEAVFTRLDLPDVDIPPAMMNTPPVVSFSASTKSTLLPVLNTCDDVYVVPYELDRLRGREVICKRAKTLHYKWAVKSHSDSSMAVFESNICRATAVAFDFCEGSISISSLRDGQWNDPLSFTRKDAEHASDWLTSACGVYSITPAVSKAFGSSCASIDVLFSTQNCAQMILRGTCNLSNIVVEVSLARWQNSDVVSIKPSQISSTVYYSYEWETRSLAFYESHYFGEVYALDTAICCTDTGVMLAAPCKMLHGSHESRRREASVICGWSAYEGIPIDCCTGFPVRSIDRQMHYLSGWIIQRAFEPRRPFGVLNSNGDSSCDESLLPPLLVRSEQSGFAIEESPLSCLGQMHQTGEDLRQNDVSPGEQGDVYFSLYAAGLASSPAPLHGFQDSQQHSTCDTNYTVIASGVVPNNDTGHEIIDANETAGSDHGEEGFEWAENSQTRQEKTAGKLELVSLSDYVRAKRPHAQASQNSQQRCQKKSAQHAFPVPDSHIGNVAKSFEAIEKQRWSRYRLPGFYVLKRMTADVVLQESARPCTGTLQYDKRMDSVIPGYDMKALAGISDNVMAANNGRQGGLTLKDVDSRLIACVKFDPGEIITRFEGKLKKHGPEDPLLDEDIDDVLFLPESMDTCVHGTKPSLKSSEDSVYSWLSESIGVSAGHLARHRRAADHCTAKFNCEPWFMVKDTENGNCEIAAIYLVAMRTILPGEEITRDHRVDYLKAGLLVHPSADLSIANARDPNKLQECLAAFIKHGIVYQCRQSLQVCMDLLPERGLSDDDISELTRLACRYQELMHWNTALQINAFN